MKLGMFVLSVSITMVSGCSQSVPECNDKVTLDLVKEVAGKEMTKMLGPEAADSFVYEIGGIRTTNTNEKTGSHECAAEMKISVDKNVLNSGPITYTVELTDDKEEIYVTVFGL